MRTLPSFTVLVTIVSLVVLLPLLAFASTRWQEANSEYEASLAVQQSAERLQLLLQLAPALSQEELSSVWVGAGGQVFDGVNTGGGAQLLPDFGATIENDRQRVDTLANQLGDVVISDAIRVVRADASAGTLGFFDYEDRYGQIVSLVETELAVEVRSLNAAVSQSGAREVIQAARVGEAAAALQMVNAGQGTRWAQLHAVDLFPAVLDDAVHFANRLAVFDERIAKLERVAPLDSTVGSLWLDVRVDRNTLRMRQRYVETVRKFAITGVDPTVQHSDTLEPTEALTILETLRLASEVNDGLDDARQFSDELSVVVQESLDAIDQSATNAVASAAGARRSILLWSLAFFALVVGGELGLVLTVGRPVRRMAYTAQRLSRGQLDATLRETGPTEVRLGARALNEALASIRIAEKQALALAEERLDDEVLEQSAPGELGKSLHAAVHRLTESISERDDFRRQLEHEASHDHLTKLANRSAVLRHLSSAMARTSRNGSTMALLFLDIDDFKAINDTHGHHSGDAVLVEVSKRLTSAIREGDLAGRLGGDEFVVIAEPVHDIDAAIVLSERILDEVNEPITVEGVTFHPSVSIGVGIANGKSQISPDQLVRDADSAVYRAKSRGKARVEVCDDDLRSRMKSRDELESAIGEAIANNDLVLHFQPSVSATTKRMVGVEALVRWDRPDVGLVYPDEFIPAAERTDLILDIDRWVLDAAVSQLGQWRDNPELQHLTVAVNISARHLGAGTLCSEVKAATDRYGVDASNLVLELTETALLEDISLAARELAAVQALGLRIALDDFGTGFMSLSHLRQLPVDILKIDRSFISGIDSETDQSLVSLIVDTGHVLGMSVTAEGVETQRQARSLRRMAVDHLQGYYFSKPVSVVEIARLAYEGQLSDGVVSST